MGSFNELGLLFAKMALAVPHGGQAGLEKAAVVVETGSKEAIGTYSFGWPALAASTLEKKGADTPLLETGALRDSIHHSVGDHVAFVGTNDPKAAWIELGTSKQPPRSFLAQSAVHHRNELVKLIGDAVKSAISFKGS